MMRGGKRKGAGGKPAWNHGKTKVIRVPEDLAEKILEITRILDSDLALDSVTLSNNDSVTESKIIDLGGITVRAFNNGPGVYLVDLVKAGYKIKPSTLASLVEKRLNSEITVSLKREVDEAIQKLSLDLDKT